ncbi:uncharacterized protein LOC143028164 [Oratosquilla oratoria]|uniref:uncharacterized protein LOC143028164 n=1 Tax=Oratosquilla oratoria TaxID=337810 RepID=UPI003F7629CB
MKVADGLGRHVFLHLIITTTFTFPLCHAVATRDNAESSSPSLQKEHGSLSEPMYVLPSDAKDQCKRPCVRKCCPVGDAFQTDAWACLSSAESSDLGTSTDVVVVPGLPACIFNFSQTSVLSRDGKGRLKIGSYAVSHKAFCIDEIVQDDGSVVKNSLVCKENVEESKVVNVIRRTSIVGNVLSVVCVAIILTIHIAKPKLNKRLGVTFLFFCAAIFFKGIHESFGRAVKFSAYPSYAACVINSMLLMYARASVPVWLSVLCMEIARRARFLCRGSLQRYKMQHWLAAYLLYGLGFPFLQCLLAGIVTTLSPETQKQSSIYDRTCIFTDRDVRNDIFLYPSIVISFLSAAIILYTYRYRTLTLSGEMVCCGSKKNSGRTVENFEFSEEEQKEDRILLASFTSEEFVSEFWQQVSLVCFWVLLTFLMLLVQLLTGRGVLSHITYLMNSFQGVYVFIIFLFNGSKRQIVKNDMKSLAGRHFWRKK